MDINEAFFRHAVYAPVAALRRQSVRRYLPELRRSERWAPEHIQADQLGRLNVMLQTAAASVEHYRDALAGTRPLAALGELHALPFVDKASLKAAPERFRASPRPPWSTAKTTGGSTGQPVTIFKNPDAMARELAATWRGYEWAGVHIGTRQARFWGVPFTPRERARARMIDFVCNRRRCSAFAFDAASLAGYERQLVRFGPSYFYGYVSMLTAFATYYRERGVRPPFQLRCIITTSEVLSPSDRALLAETFETRVFNEYGCGELGTIAHECEYGSLHVSDENMILEVIDGDRPCRPGEKGELVITELNNIAMPLIRYRTGDFGAISSRACACGRSLTVLEQVFGRAYDFVLAADGRRFHGEFLMYVFEEAQRHQLGIAQFQVEQHAVNDFTVRIVPGPGFKDSAKDLILARMQQSLGRDIRVRFEAVATIARESSGKMRVIVGMPGGNSPVTAPKLTGSSQPAGIGS